MSLPIDYLLRAIAPGHFDRTTIDTLPNLALPKPAIARCLALISHIEDYQILVSKEKLSFEGFGWGLNDNRLTDVKEIGIIPLNDYSRRAALLEIDVLVAQTIGLRLEELVEIYINNFPVMKGYEENTWYDAFGQLVWTNNKGLPGLGYLEDGKSPSRKAWEKIIEDGRTYLECQAVVDFMPGGPQTITRTFEGPFDTCDRVEDYKRAWTYFEAHKEEATT